MAAAVATSTPARLAPEPQAGEGRQQQRQEREVGLAQQVRVMDQGDDAERGAHVEQRVLPHDLAAGRQPDRERDRPHPRRRVRQHQHERRPVLAQQETSPRIAAAEGGYMNGKSRPVAGSG